MDRINHVSAEADKFGAGKDGFTDGDPTDPSSGTVVNEDFLDGVQEELIGIIEAAGLTPSNGDYSQIVDSLLLKIGVVYAAGNAIEFDGFADVVPRIIDGNSPFNERYAVASFGPVAARVTVFYNGTGIEFAYNCYWATGTGWVSTGTNEGLITLQASDSSRGPMILINSELVTNAFTEQFSIIGDPTTTNLSISGLNPMALTKVMGAISTNGGSDSTPVVATGSLNIKAPVSGKVNSIQVVIDFLDEFADANYIPTLTSNSNTDAYIFTVTSRTTALMAVEINDGSDGSVVNPLTTPVQFFVDIKGAQ